MPFDVMAGTTWRPSGCRGLGTFKNDESGQAWGASAWSRVGRARALRESLHGAWLGRAHEGVGALRWETGWQCSTSDGSRRAAHVRRKEEMGAASFMRWKGNGEGSCMTGGPGVWRRSPMRTAHVF